jgi:L-seryl-tRNA(Ser) seleniumtransferase
VKSTAKANLYRQLPSVDEVIHSAELKSLIREAGLGTVTHAAQAALASLRQEIAAGRLNEESLGALLANLPRAVKERSGPASSYSLIPVINATGVILHTNIGRAPLAADALERIRQTAGVYCNLETTETGERGERDIHVDHFFGRLLSGSSREVSTIVVNNNAAAVLLALNTLAEGGEVIVSRGELVEIGGSFRIPDIMAKSNAVLREVGSTNRTRISDYESAINERTRLLLRVHRSNFEITGFTEQPALAELVALARRRKLPLMEDLGSGMLFDLRQIGVNGEPGIRDSLEAGTDVIAYSGDKLLGGPQAGLLSGRNDLIAAMRSNPLFRALRVDKLTYAALEATLLIYAKRDYDAIPILRMMRLSKHEIARRAEAIAAKIQSPELSVELADGESALGGGAAPSAALPSCLLAICVRNSTASELAARLRGSDPPIFGRVEQDRLLLDLRTVFPEQDAILVKALLQALSK